MWDNFISFLVFVGYITTVIVIFQVITGFVLWTKGILPVLIRLGYGLSTKKIIIFAKNDNLNSLKSLLVDSGLFDEKNIDSVASMSDIGKAESKSIFLIFWPDWQEHIDDILNKVQDKSALLVYAPQESGFIPKEIMAKLNEQRNATVTNFRGRLLNDITTSIITTSYK